MSPTLVLLAFLIALSLIESSSHRHVLTVLSWRPIEDSLKFSRQLSPLWSLLHELKLALILPSTSLSLAERDCRSLSSDFFLGWGFVSVRWSSLKSYFVCSSSLKDHSSFLAQCPVFYKPGNHIFFVFKIHFRQDGKSGLCYSILARRGSLSIGSCGFI